MRKLIPIAGIVFALLLVLLSVSNVREKAVFDTVSRGDSYSAQAVRVKDKVHLFVWENTTKKQDIIRIDSDRNSFELLQVKAGNPVFYQYSYEKSANVFFYGVESYNPETEERHTLAEWAAGNTQWLAFSRADKSGKLRYATWDPTEKQMIEYESNPEEAEMKWVPVRNIKLEADAPLLGNYDKECGLQISTLDNEYFYFAVGSSHFQTEKKMTTLTEQGAEAGVAETNPTFLFVGIALSENGIWIVLMLLTVCLMLFGITHRHSLLVRMYSVSELVLLLVIVTGCVCVKGKTTENLHQMLFASAKEDMSELAKKGVAGDGFERALLEEELNRNRFCEFMLVDVDENTVVIATGVPTGVKLDLFVDETSLRGIEEARETNAAVQGSTRYRGNEVLTIACHDETCCKENEVLFGIIASSELQEFCEEEERQIRLAGFLFFTVATVFVTVILLMYQKRWKKFVDTAHSAAVDKTGYAIPKKNGHGMDVMWGSLQEMSKNVEKLDYERQRNMDAYSRFIPENLEKLFGKESLTEVPAGYLSYKTGALVQISMESLRSLQNHDYLKHVNSGIEYLREKAEYYKSVVIGTDPDNLKAKCFFEDGADAALAFAVDMAGVYTRDGLLKDKRKTMLLNSSEYCCGVAGTEEMVVPFLYSAEDELLFSYEENFRRAGVQIVMTEAVLNRLTDSSYSVRYIGYIKDAFAGRSLKLYECMDAYPEVDRKRMNATLPFFEKALTLFYSDDFYLARNTFNKVLQMNPADRIARWYLFDCEYYLNKTDASEISYALYDNPMIEQQYQK